MAVCGKCNKTVGINDGVINCDNCESSFHISCVNVSKTAYKSINKNGITWKCDNCSKRSSLSPKAKKNATLSQVQITSAEDVSVKHCDTQHCCYICQENFINKQDGFCCNVCNRMSHWACNDLEESETVLQELLSKRRIFLACVRCNLSELTNLVQALKSLEAKVDMLTAKIGHFGVDDFGAFAEKTSHSGVDDLPISQKKAGLYGNVHDVRPKQQTPSIDSLTVAEQVKLVIEEHAKEEIRSRSFIVYGAPENPSSEMDSMIDIVHQLTAVPILPVDVESINRLGSFKKQRLGPRMLRVTLTKNRVHMQNDIVKKALSVKTKSEELKNVFINSDKTSEERKIEFNLRCERRRRIAAGEANVTIDYKKHMVVSKNNEPAAQVN